ncbi:hypothetical protein KFL_002300030 [Klebsormidium nitens]|uniref:Uncharacterized protein n=1 Tax=Klebsormidium nitens TaxID=105231 RepID=A0A1Y1I861_KLENI|nr:hypothetical protein KFL_002300030 [Klebsormidium nitens]|eukprot:GAQ85331.1 hypothetical protein KFL_002300030 [Klebsormidium nitens]
MAATSARSTALPAFVAAAILLMGLVSAVPDPALCPFELGYNPTFNADGSILSCTKGQETFQVDEAGILARSLRGIGASSLGLISGIIDGDLTVVTKFVEPNAIFDLPGLGPTPIGPAVFAFAAQEFVFPPGADKSAVFQLSQYHFLDNNDPRVASVHVTVFAATKTIDYDSVWRFNLVDGRRVWQLQTTSNIKLVPRN